MKNFSRILLLLLVVVMLLQTASIGIFAFQPVDVSVETLGAATQPSKYSSQYNSGTRDVVATTLDGTSADAYYTGSNEYEVLSQQSASAIFTALQNLMRKQKYTADYDDCHDYANRTDCENGNGNGSSKNTQYLSLIYTSYTATQNQWNGWNREHVWPKSLAGDTTSGGGADLHHIRPSDAVVNSTRNNFRYGNVSNGTAKYGNKPAVGVLGGYMGKSGGETFFEPLDNVKGDVARICLYVYVRWNSQWGASNITQVFQSIDVLLEWCELDPVDTWELGRNEVVQDIQGNRNVFIDYPEYAWLIFGREVPSDMVTPSGEAQGSGHNWDNGVVTTQPGCETTGVKTYTCTDPGCNKTKTETIPSTGGHSYNNGVVTTNPGCQTTGVKTYTCTKCGGTKTETTPSLGHSWNSGIITTAPSCTANGIKTTTCERCGDTTTATVNATGHSYGDWITDTEPTETANGSKHRVCGTCNSTETGIIPSLDHEHSYTDTVTNPTCTEQGYTTHTCSGCGESYRDTYVNATGHTYNSTTNLCNVCGVHKDEGKYTVANFNDIVNRLSQGNLPHNEVYDLICEALEVYATFTASNKTAATPAYTQLISIIGRYNNDADNHNTESKTTLSIVFGTAVAVISVSTLGLGICAIAGKKYY